MARQIGLHYCGYGFARRWIGLGGALQLYECLGRRNREDRNMIHRQPPDFAIRCGDLQGHGMEDVAAVGGKGVATACRESAGRGIAAFGEDTRPGQGCTRPICVKATGEAQALRMRTAISGMWTGIIFQRVGDTAAAKARRADPPARQSEADQQRGRRCEDRCNSAGTGAGNWHDRRSIVERVSASDNLQHRLFPSNKNCRTME